MNIATHTSNVTKYSNFLISISFKFRTIFFNYYTSSNIDEEIKSSLLINNQILGYNMSAKNQMSILRVNRSKTKYCVIKNGMITWNSLPDTFKVNISFSMFKSMVRNFFLENYQKILMQGYCIFFLTFFFPLLLHFFLIFKCNCIWFWVLCCEISNYFFCGYDQHNQECYCKLDMFVVSETIIVRPFHRNQDCYCDYFTLIVFNQVRFRLRLGCPGSLMSLYGPTFHVTPVYLFIILKCNLYISYIMSCGNKKNKNCFKQLQYVVQTYILFS